LGELLSLVEGGDDRSVPVIAFVGAGGKTSSMFALARAFASERAPSGPRAGAREPSGPRARPPSGPRILVTTTTRILDPDRASRREGRGFGAVLVHPDPASSGGIALLRSSGPRIVLASRRDESGTKLAGVAPEALAELISLFDAVLVEADGARGLSIKAPSEREPVLPPRATAVIGLLGLDALGKPLDERIAHRPELLGPLVGCAPGEAISPEHLLRLASSPAGLFKGAPGGAKRIILLNKADEASPTAIELCASLLRGSATADAVVVGALGVTR
jgi:probable selenium-dependent hydroxylase accessory protein YqeC